VIRVFRNEHVGDRPALLVALHGDTAPWNRSGAQYVFAEAIASQADNVVAVGMVRPGYVDPDGLTSDGEQGEGVGDNYDAPRVDQIASAIRALANAHDAAGVVLVGESGGAAVAANLIARHPGLVDRAVLIVCPCDVRSWRENMVAVTGKTHVFGNDIEVLSPIDAVDQIADTNPVYRAQPLDKPERAQRTRSHLMSVDITRDSADACR
jgi:pimeloyl-ACP methyl ester carboxylesterase